MEPGRRSEPASAEGGWADGLYRAGRAGEILDCARKEIITETAQKPFALVDRMDLSPLCPHCDEEIAEVYRKGTGFPLGQGRTLVYFCPHCLKVLGFAQGRVF